MAERYAAVLDFPKSHEVRYRLRPMCASELIAIGNGPMLYM